MTLSALGCFRHQQILGFKGIGISGMSKHLPARSWEEYDQEA